MAVYTYIEVAQYEGAAQDTSYYKFYTLSQSEAKQAVGTTEKVTYATCAEWLGKDFAANSAALTAYRELNAIQCDSTVNAVDSTPIYGNALYDAIVVGIYDNGTDKAYNVFANCDYFDLDAYYDGDHILVRTSEASSGWLAASDATSVPEPTSGLLLLLGFAGLALKRKRA